MNSKFRKPAVILGLLVLVGLGVLAYARVAPEARPCSRLADFPLFCGQSQVNPQVDLRIGALDLDARRLTGTAQVTLRSGAFPPQTWENFRKRGKVAIFLDQSLGPGRYRRIGGSTAEVELFELPGQELTGDGSFWWNFDTLTSEFWYPFDRHKLVLNPRLAVPEAGMSMFSMYPIDRLQLTMSGPDLYMDISQIEDNNPVGHTYEVILERSLFIRLTDVVVGVTALLVTIFFVFIAKIDQLDWKPLTFFAAIWGIRGILRGDLPSSSLVLIDYATILIYGTVAVAIIVRWGQYQRHQDNTTRSCPFCLTRGINKLATRCPFCTSEIA